MGEPARVASENTVLTGEEDTPLPRLLVVMFGGEVTRWLLPVSGTLLVGRSRECDIEIDDASVSRQHARLRVGDEVTIEDLGSSNGTSIGGSVLAPNTAVRIDGSEVLRLGAVSAVVQPMARPGAVAVFSATELRATLRSFRSAGVVGLIAIALDHESTMAAVVTAIGDLDAGDLAARSGPRSLELMVHAESTQAVERKVSDALVVCRQYLGSLRASTRIAPRDGVDLVALLDEAHRELVPNNGGAADGVIVQSPSMRALYALAEQCAEGQLSVLLVAETGAGKEHLAERIHHASSRAPEPFVRVNCAAFAETMFEAEFFGYERGAFTGAAQPKAGLLEHAGNGTVFLDEVGELPLTVQAKLLRVLEERQVTRVGSLKPRALGARFVAATNRDLAREVERGAFRKDLYFRLAGVILEIPPLRARVEEIRPLAETFAARAARALGRAFVPRLAPSSLRALEGYRWEGNVRELRNVMERAVLLCRGDTIEVTHLLLPTTEAPPTPSALPAAVPIAAAHSQEERLRVALQQTGGNQKAAAKMLGVSRQTVGKWIDKYHVVRPRRHSVDEDDAA